MNYVVVFQQDLMQIPTKALEVTLQKAVSFARNHVLSCTLCSQKGFICEICTNPKVIYPFDIDTNYKVSFRTIISLYFFMLIPNGLCT